MQITLKSKWNSRGLLAILIAFSLLSTSCKNMFSELARPDADAAIFYSAKRLADARQYEDAINKVYELSDSYYNRREVQVFLASALAGKCGLDFLEFADSVINNPTARTPMELALDHMKDATSEADCVLAETVMRDISPDGDGIMSDSVDDAIYMAFISLAKVGAVLARVADTDDDGVVDGGYDACAMASADAREVGSGITLLYNNIRTTSGDFADKMSAMTTICGLAGTACSKTDKSTFTDPAELTAIRGVVDFQDFGLGSDAVYPSCP